MFDLPTYCDSRGCLSVLEKHLPFKAMRIYWIYANSQGLARGGHRHHVNDQVLVAVHGSCRVYCDDSSETADFLLDSPGKALNVKPQDWHKMYAFSEDCVLLVIASHGHDVSDYIDEPYREVPEHLWENS